MCGFLQCHIVMCSFRRENKNNYNFLIIIFIFFSINILQINIYIYLKKLLLIVFYQMEDEVIESTRYSDVVDES